MALYSLDIEKRLGSEFWSNRYIVQQDTLGAAVSFGAFIAQVERAFHHTSVLFTRYRVSTLVQNDDAYQITAIGQQGTRTGSGTLLPLFNTLRADITALNGRPSRKYWRGVLGEDDIGGDLINTNFQPLLAEFEEFFATSGDPWGLVDPQGTLFTAITMHPYVQMRQLRRSRRRRDNGGGIFQ